MSGEIGQAWWEADLKDEKLRAKLRELDGLLRQHGAMSEATLNRGWNQALDNAGRTLQNVGRQMSSTGASMTRNLTLPIIGAGVATGKLAMDFDTTMRQIVGLTDVTSAEIGKFRDQILAMGPELGRSPQELAEAFYFVASAGFTGAEAMKVLRTAAVAASAGLGDTQSVARVLGSVINAYGKENITAARAADILTEAISQGTAEAPEFASVIGRVAPTAAALGITFDQVAGSLAGMTLTGLSAEESATSLNQVMISLLKPTVQAEEALNGMGLASADLRRQLREEGLLSVLRTLEERFAGNDEAAASVFGNIRALRGVTSLLTLDATQLNDIFNKVNDSTGRLATGFDAMAGPQFKVDQAMAQLKVTAIELGQDVLPVAVEILTELAGGARELAKWWGTLDDETKRLVVQMIAVVAIGGPALSLLGKLTSGVGGLFRGVAFLTGARGLPLLATQLRTMRGAALGVVGAIGALILAFYEMDQIIGDTDGGPAEWRQRALDHFSGAKDDVLRIVDELGIGYLEAHALMQAADDEFAGGHEEATDRVIAASRRLEDAQVGSSSAAHKWSDEQRAAYANAFGGVSEGVDAAALEAAGLPPEIAAILSEGSTEVGAGADMITAEMAEAAAAAREAVLDQMAATLAGLAGMFDSDESVREAWQALIDRMDDPYTEAERKADIFGTDMTTGIREGLASGDPALIGDTTDLVNRLLGEFALMEPGALESGEAVPPGLRAGMDAQMGALIAYIEKNVTGESLAAMELDAVPPGLEGIASYARGMRRNELLAVRAAQSVAGQAKAALSFDAASGGASSLGTWISGMEGAWGAQQYRIKGIVGHAANLFGRSLPTEGPLKGGVFSGGYSVGESFIIGNVRALEAGLRAIGASVSRVGAVMSGLAPDGGAYLDYAGASVSSASGLGGVSIAGSGAPWRGTLDVRVAVDGPLEPAAARAVGEGIGSTLNLSGMAGFMRHEAELR